MKWMETDQDYLRTVTAIGTRASHEHKSLQYVIKSCFSKIFQTKSDDVIAECMNMFSCLPVADEISRRKNIFCLGSDKVITFYVICAVLLHFEF